MTDVSRSESDKDEVKPFAMSSVAFLDVYDTLRARPDRWRYQAIELMERRTRKRLPASADLGNTTGQRGDIAEPPPVLDLEVERDEDRAALVELLRKRSVLHPFWGLSQGTGSGTGNEQDREAGEEPGVTTEELYRRMRVFIEGPHWPEGLPKAEPGMRPPPPSHFRRLRSLMDLQKCNAASIHKGATGTEPDSENPRLGHDRKTQFYGAAELRDIRSRRAEASARGIREKIDEEQEAGGIQRRLLRARSSLADVYAQIARTSAGASAWLASAGNFGRMDSILLTPFSFVVNIVLSLGSLAVIHLVIEQISTVVTFVAAALVFVGLLVRPPMLHLPWARYRWLNEHRYIPHGEGSAGQAVDHRTRGIDVLNLLNEEHRGWIGSGRKEDLEPPRIHRLVVNAFLDDLHHTYGSTNLWHSFGPRNKRVQRPVIVVDQARADRVTVYLLRLIEDERLRRALPDPLLLVQIRGRDEAPLLVDTANRDRYLTFPELHVGRVKSPGEGFGAREDRRKISSEVARWRRHRYAAGVLGTGRFLTQRVSAESGGWRENPERPAYDWTPSPATLAKRCGVGAVVIALLVAGAISVVKPFDPCFTNGVVPPLGMVRVKGECIGVAGGEVAFHPRLEKPIKLIYDQNKMIKDDDKYVTFVHVAELSTKGDDKNDREDKAPGLAGIHGELYGIADAQEHHNRTAEGWPKVKILLANTGQGWAHWETTANQIDRLVGDENLGKDRLIGALGFGQSVDNNNKIISALSDEYLPMAGTTVTFDGIALHHNDVPSNFFFPIAPSNTRIAKVAASWARGEVPVEMKTEDGGSYDGKFEVADTAVAIADASKGDIYGLDLAQKFMSEFIGEDYGERGSLPGGEGSTEVFEYESGGDNNIKHQIKELCKNPPDLIYYAGRSTDFGAFYGALEHERNCPVGGIDILAGDDVTKYVTDNPKEFKNDSGYPVYYTPLAASGAWNKGAGVKERTFHNDMKDVIDEYSENEDGKEDPEGGPSIAHAVMGHDALYVMIESLEYNLGEAKPDEFLKDDDFYKEYKSRIHSNIQCGKWTGVSGQIQFNGGVNGNWNDDRAVQLVRVGPVNDKGEHQHVLEVEGQLSPKGQDLGQGCIGSEE